MTDMTHTIRIEIDQGMSVRNPFSLLLSRGVVIQTQVGCSIIDLLCAQVGVDRDYVENRIQTIFLNGEVIDDVENTVVMDRDVLALSAAMPGVAGATLRRGGRYAPMRSNISYGQQRAECELAQGTVNLKLFNLVVRELGPLFLAHGVTIKGGDWLDFLDFLPTAILQNCRSITVNDQPAEVMHLANADWRDDSIHLVVRSSAPR